MYAAEKIMYQIPSTSVGSWLGCERLMKLMDKDNDACVHEE